MLRCASRIDLYVKTNSLSEICLIVPFLHVLTVYKATQSLAYLV